VLSASAEAQAMTQRLVVVCAWCQRDLGTKPSREAGISHGICRLCSAAFRAERNAKAAPC
jgi:hypothetical protein